MSSAAVRQSARPPRLAVRSRVRGAQVAPLRRVATVFAARHLPTRNVAIDVEVVGPARMRTLNRTWRGKDAPTDVLSLEAAVPPAGPVLLGPIVLCPAVAARGETSAERSLPYLFAHGLLHALGWDHRNGAQERRMDAEVRVLLDGAGERVL